MKGLRYTALAATAAVLALGSTAMAQTPTFSLGEDIFVAPGGSVQVPVFLEGGVANTQGYNLTLRVPTAQASLLNGAITGSIAQGAGYVFQENNLTTGEGTEYRMVVYPTTSASTAFDTTAKVQIATVTIPVAPIGAVLDLIVPSGSVNGFDTSVPGTKIGLLGVSDNAGNSIVADSDASGTRDPEFDRPLASSGAATVGYAGYPEALDFVPTGSVADFIYRQFLPTFSETGTKVTGASNAGSGFTLTLADTADVSTSPGRVFFGVLTYDFGFLTRTEGNINPPAVGQIIQTTWNTESDVAVPWDLPTARIRINAADNSVSTESVYQSFSQIPEIPPANNTMPSAGNPRGLTTWTFFPDFAADGTPTVGNPAGFNSSFDFYYTGRGTQGSSMRVKSLVTSIINPASLASATTLGDFDFTTGTNGFGSFTFPVDAPVLPVNYSNGSDGLGIQTQGAPTEGGTVISFGFWERPALFQVDPSKIYRVTYTVGTDNVNRDTVSSVRLRFLVGGTFDYAYLTINTAIGDEQAMPVSGDDSTFVNYFAFPPATAGRDVIVAFDAYRNDASLADEFVYLRNLKIEALTPPSQ